MFDPYYKWLGIPPSDRPPNRYQLLLGEHNGTAVANPAKPAVSAK
jgi:hypothetical protein